jgi:hypothetical protein
MKKFLVLAVVLVAVCISTAAYALDVTVNGEVAVRSRFYQNVEQNVADSHGNSDNVAYTQARYDVAVNIKGDGVRGVLEVWNDWSEFGGGGSGTANMVGGGRGVNDGGANRGMTGTVSQVLIRQAFIEFTVPGTPVSVLGGRWLSRMGEGWFLRSEYGGQDGWLVTVPFGKVASIAFQDVKLYENFEQKQDDTDLYSIIATVKPTDTFTINANVSFMKDKYGAILNGNTLQTANLANIQNGVAFTTNEAAQATGELWNIGLSWNGKLGIVVLKGEIDVQSGRLQQTGSIGTKEFDGFQGIMQVSVPVGIVTINAGAAYGSGNRPGSSNISQIVTLLDIGQHYSYIYEYRTVNGSRNKNTGLQNTMFLSGGVMVQATKSLAVGFDTYWLQMAEYATNPTNGGINKPYGLLGEKGNNSKDIGVETDVKVNWQITPNLSWNWQLCWLATGPAWRTAGGYESDMYAVQGVLSLKF